LISAIISEIGRIKSSKKELREFGLTIGAILVILGGVALWRHRPSYPYLLAAGVVFAVSGLLAPAVLKPLQKAWMALAVVMGFFVSRIVLFLLFYAVVTPIGLLTRIMGKDILDQKIDKKRRSYWIERAGPEKAKQSYENQY
jgi:multisubunit Na+/H+ antiporter MnhG subunit